MSNFRSQTPIILGRPFLATVNAIIICRNRSMRLIFGDMTKEINVFNLEKHRNDMDNLPFEVNLIEDLTNKHKEEINLEVQCDAELESENFKLDEVVNSTIECTSSPSSLDPKPTCLTSPYIKSPPFLKLKALPKHLKYAYLGE